MSKRPRAEPSGSGADGPSGWRVSLPDDGVAVLCMAATGTLALGLHAGAIALLTERGLESRRLDGHAGGTLALATSTASDGRNYLVSAGADGCVRIWSVETGAQLSAHPLDGGTRGVHGCLVDTLSVSGPLWAAAMGRCARVGAVDGAADRCCCTSTVSAEPSLVSTSRSTCAPRACHRGHSQRHGHRPRARKRYRARAGIQNSN